MDAVTDELIKTTIRLTPETHKQLRAACALSGETLSEFITRVSEQELDRLVKERQTAKEPQP